jgi:transcriptional regulator with XRE-family HTH domain
MPKTQINTKTLYAALDAQREARGISWRQLAHEVEVSPSTLSRLGQGKGPAADVFVALAGWLGLAAEQFIETSEGTREGQEEPDVVAQLAPLLRARKDLTEQDVTYLEEIIGAAVRRFRAERYTAGR